MPGVIGNALQTYIQLKQLQDAEKYRQMMAPLYQAQIEKAKQDSAAQSRYASPELMDLYQNVYPQARTTLAPVTGTTGATANVPGVMPNEADPWGRVPIRRREKDVLTDLGAAVQTTPLLAKRRAIGKEQEDNLRMDQFLDVFAQENPTSSVAKNLDKFKMLPLDQKVTLFGNLHKQMFPEPGASLDKYLLAKKQFEENPANAGKQYMGIQDWELMMKKTGKPETTINLYEPTKGTQSKLEEQFIDGRNTIGRLQNVKNLFEPEFLRTGGQLLAKGIKLTDRLGQLKNVEDIANIMFGNTGSEAIEQSKNFTKRLEKFAAAVKQATFLWRKFITGVAGGEKEMSRIEEMYVNMKDAPLTFIDKVDEFIEISNATMRWARDLYAKGILKDNQSKAERDEILREFPIEGYIEETQKTGVPATSPLPDQKRKALGYSAR